MSIVALTPKNMQPIKSLVTVVDWARSYLEIAPIDAGANEDIQKVEAFIASLSNTMKNKTTLSPTEFQIKFPAGQLLIFSDEGDHVGVQLQRNTDGFSSVITMELPEKDSHELARWMALWMLNFD
jgi:hypothetical protein